MMRVFVVAAFAALAAADDEPRSKMIVKNTGDEDLALYFMGSIDDGDMSLWDGSETLNDIVEPGAATARYVRFNDSFAIRSGDLKWRGGRAKILPVGPAFCDVLQEDDARISTLQKGAGTVLARPRSGRASAGASASRSTRTTRSSPTRSRARPVWRDASWRRLRRR